MSNPRSHEWIDQRSLAMAQAIARKLRHDPSLFETAGNNLDRWRSTIIPWPPALAEWEQIIAGGMERALSCLLENSARGRRLRQSHPFPGVLTTQERNEILRHYESIAI